MSQPNHKNKIHILVAYSMCSKRSEYVYLFNQEKSKKHMFSNTNEKKQFLTNNNNLYV